MRTQKCMVQKSESKKSWCDKKYYVVRDIFYIIKMNKVGVRKEE